MTDDQPQTYSIMLHLRRTTHEDAYLNVPVTDDLLRTEEDGALHIDPDAFMAEGIRLGGAHPLEWVSEETVIEVHPIQQPLPEGRSSFDVADPGGGR